MSTVKQTSNLTKMVRQIIIMIFLSQTIGIGCFQTSNEKKILANDIRLFKGTEVWELAQAVEKEDTVLIKQLISEKSNSINFQEPKFGLTLLHWTAITHKIKSAEILLRFGANPNIYDTYSGSNPMIDEIKWHCHNNDTSFFKLLLKYGSDPNFLEKGERREGNWRRQTPLFDAARCSYTKTKILVEAGADINFKNEFGNTALREAIGGGIDAAKTTRYLLIYKKADFTNTFVVTINNDTTFFVGLLREWTFDLNSEDFKIKQEIIEYLKEKGQDYWQTAIPPHFYKIYPKDYLDKY